MQVYDNTGRQLSSTIRLSSAVSFLQTDTDSCLLGLLSDARLWMWDVRLMKCILETSVEDLGGTSHGMTVRTYDSFYSDQVIPLNTRMVENCLIQQFFPYVH